MLMEQLTAVKMEKYELIESKKKMQKEIDALRVQAAKAARAEDLLAASRDAQAVADVRHENENMREQVKLLKQSMQQLFDGQQKAQTELEYLRKVQSKGAFCCFVCVIDTNCTDRPSCAVFRERECVCCDNSLCAPFH